MSKQIRLAVVQDGARLHYAVPAALHGRGMLERVFCDWYSGPGRMDLQVARLLGPVNPELSERMRGRFSRALKGAKVLSHPFRTLQDRVKRKQFRSDSEYGLWQMERDAQWILRKGMGDATGVFGFIRNISPRLCESVKGQGLMVVADQMIAPAAIEVMEGALQQARFPEWARAVNGASEKAFIEVEERTWAAADQITCASEYVREGLLKMGVAGERVSVNPYPIESRHYPFVERKERSGRVQVGFVGGVNLRKGAPYFLEIAKRLEAAAVDFTMVGPIGVSEAGEKRLRERVELAGAVPRSRIYEMLGRFDVFLFPSTCEGSAGAIMEAMSTGLPVVTSPNSGSVVRDGVDGFIVPYESTDGAVEAVEKLVVDKELRLRMGEAAAGRAREFDLPAYGVGLAAVVEKASEGHGTLVERSVS